MKEALFWLYFINSILLIIHEIDSAYWKEWHQFRQAFGWFNSADDNQNMRLFLLLHFPIIGLILWGLLEVYKGTQAGFVISVILASGGLFAFFFHNFWLIKGRKEFDVALSKWVLRLTLITSLAQLAVVGIIFFQV